MSDFMDSIFQSVDILIDKKLEDLSYDTTVICTIIDCTDSKNGKYRVTDGSVSYIAYSDKDNFREGEQVRVNIPKGDFTQKKFIIGKYYADENASPITYVSPLESVVNISGNLMTPILGAREYGILANGPIKKQIIWNQYIDPNQFRDMQANGIYNTLIVKADFKTLLYNHNYVAGTYGLRIELLVRPSPDSKVKIKRTVELTSKEMFGNPYNFAVYSPQAKTFSIVTVGIIEGIELSLFQNGDFVNAEGSYINPPLNMADNILIKNIELGFGSNLLDVEDNVVRIYSENGLQYNYMPHTDDTNRKKIGLVWYNKDENNQYLGFSDGIYDTLYDEMDYLIQSNKDTRLLAQKGREDVPSDEFGLKLAADIEEAIPILQRISSMLTQDLCGELNYFKDYCEDGSMFKNTLSSLVNTISLIAKTLREPSSSPSTYRGGNLISKLEQYYKSVLKYISDQVNRVDEPSDQPSTQEENNFFPYIFKVISNNGSSDKSICLNWILTEIKNINFNLGYQEVYDNCLIRVQRIINKIYDVINSLPEGMDNDFSTNVSNICDYINNFDVDYFESYNEEDFSDMANKYCIYWYRYEEGYEDTADKFKLMPNGWRRLAAADLKNPLGGPYFGLPEKNSELNEEGKEVFAPQPDSAESFVYPYMRNDQPQEKFVAVVCYNHAIYKSNELIFTNTQDIPDKNTLDKSDVLQFEHVQGQYSSDSYLIYNDNYYLRDSADEHRDREILCHYDGLLAGDEALINARIYWYVPKNSTMISYDRNFLINNRGFDTDDGASLHYSKEGYVCFYKQIFGKKNGTVLNFKLSSSDSALDYDNRSFWYRVKPYYEPSAVKNHILCKVVPGNDFDSVDSGEYFTFGIAGTNGTKYTLAITNTSPKCALDNDSADPLDLNIILKDANNATVPFKDTPEITWYMHTVTGPFLNTTSISNNIFSIIGHDGCGILKASTNININSEVEGSAERVTTLQCLYAVPWRKGNYYLSGPTFIGYNNFGTLDYSNMFDNAYALFESNTNKKVSGVTWSIVYYEKGSGGSSLALADLTKPYRDYVPQLNPDNGLTPSTLYMEDNPYIPVVIARKGGDIVWMQPIIITKNKYSSPLLNNWDGSFKIDKDNGTILSSMIGAGRKNAKNNTFDGVLMGNVELEANISPADNPNLGLDNKSGIGIYGFNDGAQSFGFNIDGTAFLGKSGRGRIIFNGNYGVIASANWFSSGGSIGGETGGITKQSEAGMCIDLENGHIDAYNFRLTSKNIYFNSNPEQKLLPGQIDKFSNNYFMRIGDSAKGFIALDKNGNLEMRVNSFYLTGTLGGENLLKQTSPRKLSQAATNNHTYKNIIQSTIESDGKITVNDSTNIPVNNSIYDTNGNITYDWTVSKWSPTGSVGGIEIYEHKDYPLYLIGNTTTSQSVTLEQDHSYTLSGWVNKEAQLDISFGGVEFVISYAKWNSQDKIDITKEENAIYQSGNKIILKTNDGEWNYFEITFKPKVSANQISFNHRATMYIWHLKLEHGTIATSWNMSPDDVEENSNLRVNNLDAYLVQDQLFNRLFKDPVTGQVMDGIVLKSENETPTGRKELYINATYIATGILRSKNFNGTIKVSMIGDKATYALGTTPTAGMYINLDEGKIWASENFELTAGSQNTDNFLFLTSKDGATIKLGSHTDASFTYSTNTWRIIAGKYFGVTKDGTVFAEQGKIGGWTLHRNKLYGGGTINGVKSGFLPVCVQVPTTTTSTVFAVGGDPDHSSYQNADTRVFYVRADGKMYAKNAEIEGKIIAKSGTIGSWNISDHWIDSYTGTRENNGYTSRFFLDSNAGTTNYYLYAAADIGDGAGYTCKFSVSKYGVLYAKGAQIEGEITASSGKIGDCTISGGVLKVPAANISGKLDVGQLQVGNISITPDQIDTSTSKIQASQISVGGIKITPNQIDVSSGKILAGQIDVDNLVAKKLAVTNFKIDGGTFKVMSSLSAGTTATENARFGDSIISNSWYKGITCVLKKVEMQIGNVGGDYADLYFCNGVLVGMCKTGFWS